VYVPLESELELTVAVEEEPKKTSEADIDSEPPTFGLALTVNDAVFPLEILLVQDKFFTAVIVKVVIPPEESNPPGIVNVPLPELIFSVAVLFVALLAPPRLYVTVYVPFARVVE
jgi:hypothetical protein